jgi:hypothetical protein
MKTLFTLLMPVLIIASAVVTNNLFSQGAYLASAFFTMVCFFSTSLWITILSSRKLVIR